jgi:hypothetical protein
MEWIISILKEKGIPTGYFLLSKPPIFVVSKSYTLSEHYIIG